MSMQTRIVKRGIEVDRNCKFCFTGEESRYHLLLICGFSHQIQGKAPLSVILRWPEEQPFTIFGRSEAIGFMATSLLHKHSSTQRIKLDIAAELSQLQKVADHSINRMLDINWELDLFS
ncbi:hypothetical protein PTKIN_Ptkin16aG0086500 [Pterospermum kingtungense]